jgi:hypothetical protein
MAASAFQRRLILAGCAAVTIAAGLIWRFAIPGLPWFAWKYGGSALWATMVYFLIAFVIPRCDWRIILAAACAVSVGVEFSRLIDVDLLNPFRATLAGKLTLGAVFSLWNLPAYFAGAAAGAFLDRVLILPRNRSQSR